MRDIQRYSENYQKEYFEEKIVAYRHRKVKDILQRTPHRNLLEVGCGVLPIYHFVEDFESLTIVEPSPLFCCEIRERDEEVLAGRPIRLINDFLESCCESLRDKPYDFILVSSLIHEVEEPEKLLQSVLSLCGTDTVVHLNVPNQRSFHNLLALDAGIIQDITALSSRARQLERHSTYNMDSLQEFVQRQGFTVLESGYYFLKPFSNSQMQKMLDLGILNDTILDGLYTMCQRIPEMGAEMYVNVQKKRESVWQQQGGNPG